MQVRVLPDEPMICKICKTTESLRWKKELCSSCYNKQWRENNSLKVKEYNLTDETRFIRSKSSAKFRNIDWKISLSEFKVLCNKECYYCTNLICNKVLFSSGLDRINNDIGYQIDNVVSCCESCNLIKNETLSSEEMKLVAKYIISLRTEGQVTT